MKRWLVHRIAERLTIKAFRQAMRENGIPPHWRGQCPTPECDCGEKADLVHARAAAIIEGWCSGPQDAVL